MKFEILKTYIVLEGKVWKQVMRNYRHIDHLLFWEGRVLQEFKLPLVIFLSVHVLWQVVAVVKECSTGVEP